MIHRCCYGSSQDACSCQVIAIRHVWHASVAVCEPYAVPIMQAVRQPQQSVMSYFDYGTSCRSLLVVPRPCNQVMYGQMTPPTYDLSGIRNKLVLFTGELFSK